jgi:hypothetical protein
MTKELSAVFAKADAGEYVARHANTNVVYRVVRHRWMHPEARLSWRAYPVRDADGKYIDQHAKDAPRTQYQNTLQQMAYALGYEDCAGCGKLAVVGLHTTCRPE